MSKLTRTLICLILLSTAACAPKAKTVDVYFDPAMDFGVVKVVAVMPLANLARDPVVSERVRDVVINKLLSTGAVYVLPIGEVARGIARLEIPNPATPSPDDIAKLGGIIKAQAVITGAVKEYGEVRSGTTTANIISLSLQMAETQTGKVVWSASSTQGGITIWDRLIGGGGEPMNLVTEKAVNDLVKRLLD